MKTLKTKNPKFCYSFLLLALGLILFSCNTDDKSSAEVVGTTEEKNPDKLPDDTTAVAIEEEDTIAIRTVTTGSNLIKCGEGKITDYLMEIAAKHSNVPYDYSDPSTQCSGIFQRFLGTVRERCTYAVGKTPPETVLDSREQGKWYFDNNALVLITDPLAQDSFIRPGMVMFYGNKTQEFYNANPVSMLWDTDNGIRHVGVVVAVKRDENDQIQSYSLFHGRNPDTPSGISNADDYMHRRDGKGVPAFGNGDDPWVGVAAIVLQE